MNHVNNVVYLQWVNDISEKHWNWLASPELRAKYFWVVLRHEIDYLNEKYKLNIPESDEYETLAGLILYHYERIPKINDRIHIPGFVIRILDVSETRIEMVHLSVSREA